MSVETNRIDVLHVDDERGFRDLAAEFLERESDALEVVTAGSAAEGLDRLAADDVDCIVSDYDMPRTDGLEFLAAVREDHPELPFVLFTGKGSEEIASEAISAGVTDYIQKRGPEQFDLLARRVENAVAQYRAERRLERTQDKLESLHEMALELMAADTTAEIYDLAVEAADGILDLETCGIYELTDGEFVPRSVRNLDHDGEYLSEGEGVAGTVFRTGESKRVGDVQESNDAHPLRDRFRSTLTVPVGDFGVFQATTEAVDAYSKRDLELTEVLMSHVTKALESVEYERDLRAVNDRLEAILENTTALIYVKDLDGRYELVNDRFASVLGMDREEVLGKTDFDIQSEKYAREVRENDRRAIDTESPVEVEEEAFRDDEVRTYISVKVPMFDEDGDPVGVCGISTDITERKRREERLEERTEALRDRNERLDEFARIVSHDLRNPLGVAEGRLELAREDCDSDHLAEVAWAHDRMRTLVDDLLTVAREGGEVDDPEPVDLAEMVRRCWRTVDAGGATLLVEAERSVEADERRLRQLLENLLRNCVEHGTTGPSEPGTLTITVGDLPDGFYVEDDGPGIPPADRDAVFEAGHTTSEDGTGFGLAIVRRIAEAHGWAVAAVEGSDGARVEVTGVD